MAKVCPACGRSSFTADEREKMGPVLIDVRSKRMTIPASEIGLSLTLSDEAAAEIEQIIDEQARAAMECRDMVWR